MLQLSDLFKSNEELFDKITKYVIEKDCEFRKFVLLKQHDYSNHKIIAEGLGFVLNKKVEVLYFKHGDKFRIWLKSQNPNIESRDTLLKLCVGKEYTILELTRTLQSSGYNRQIRAQEQGDYSLLGDVLQIFMYGFNEVLRVSFLGNNLESISLINAESKKSVSSFEQFEILSASVFVNDDVFVKQIPDSIFVGNHNNSESFPIRFVMVGDSLPGYDINKFDFGIDKIANSEIISGNAKVLQNSISQYLRDGYKVLLPLDTPETIKQSFLSANTQIEYFELSETLKESISAGFELKTQKLVVFTQFEISAEVDISEIANEFSKNVTLHKSGMLKLFLNTRVKAGDFVVHADHGIARFAGIQLQNDVQYFILQYAGSDKLYVPFDQASKITKYIGSSKSTPNPTKLNSGAWGRVTQSIKKDLKQIAKELLQIYILRKNSKLKSNNILESVEFVDNFKMFLGAFEYKETEDQIASTQEILYDIKKGIPMDRLVVGDVGFGKTEVAMRAAFIHTQLGNQVAVLAPTTVLVEQHKAVFRMRFASFANIVIESLSRLNSIQEQRDILQRLSEGKVDILIGTHAILSERIKFNKLGLIIVDEEQRFGVKHKEKLKSRKLDVDILTLTATPIPRTLNMALSGLRDMSVISIPPVNRKSIINKIGNFNWDEVIVAIEKEAARGGQVYFLHNRVADIDWIALHLSKLLPNMNIDVVHGQMSNHLLAKVMADFAKGEITVLVCTTIIENGIDLANVNTLIVDDIEKLGLAQMYQIRGRVGRSDKQAYAYFFYSKLRGNSTLRIEAMQDYSELGAGYKLASRDLEIRGAGSVLGDSQSGFIDSVGYALYLEMLNEEMAATGSNINTKIGYKEIKSLERIWLR